MDYKRISRNDAILNVSSVEDDEDVIDLLELFRAILKHIKLIIVLCILFGVGGFFGTKLLIAPTYTASTSIYLTLRLVRVDLWIIIHRWPIVNWLRMR